MFTVWSLKLRCVNKPEYILSDYIHKLQSGTNKEDNIFDISRWEPATLESKHLFHFMFLENIGINMKRVFDSSS